MPGTPHIGQNARIVMAIGDKLEPSDRDVDGPVKISYVEDQHDYIYVELDDGSTWRIPGTEADAAVRAGHRIAEAYNGPLSEEGSA